MQKGFAEHQHLGLLVQAGDLDTALAVLEGHISRSADSYWRLNIRSESAGMRHDHPEYDESETPSLPEISSKLNRRNEGGDTNEIDENMDNSVDDIKYVDEYTPEDNAVDEKGRGRPRLHADDAERKRVWAARRRANLKLERAAKGIPAPKRGRPRKSQNTDDAESRSASV